MAWMIMKIMSYTDLSTRLLNLTFQLGITMYHLTECQRSFILVYPSNLFFYDPLCMSLIIIYTWNGMNAMLLNCLVLLSPPSCLCTEQWACLWFLSCTSRVTVV